MKQSQHLYRFLNTILFLTVTTLTWAYDFAVNGIYYNKNSDGTSVTVTYKTSSDRGYDFSSVVIPSTVTYDGKTYSVTSIGYEAFYNSCMTSITIPESITSIGSWAFHNSYMLTKAEFASIESLCKIKFSDSASNPLYYAKHLYIDGQEVTDVVIPNSVTSIGNHAFRGCSGLTSVTIPNSVTSIGYCAFFSCSGLTSVTIPNSVTSIGDDAFCVCESLKSITIPNSVTSIGSDAFYNCSGLTKAEFASIESLCKIKFSKFSSNPLYYAKHLYIDGQEVTDVVIPNSITSINAYTFWNCSSLKSVTIPNSVTSIGSYAFQDCTGLTSVTIPNSVTSIGSEAFYKCSGLTSVTLNSNSIVSKTYTSRSNISTIFGSQVKEYVLGDNITAIGSYAFYNCTGLSSVICHAQKVPSAGSYVFYNVPSTATLYVPAESVEAYKSASQWKNFGTILPITPTAVESLIADDVSDEAGEPAIYDLHGRRLQHKPAHGFYIQSGKKFFVK